ELVLEHILKPLGNNYTRLGDYEQAMFIHRRCIVMAELLGDDRAMAGIYSNMANTAAGMGQPALAKEYCRSGLSRAGGSAGLKGLLLSELADAFHHLGEADSARRAISQSILLLKPLASDPYAGYWLLMALQGAGDIFMEADP